jgi:hypothetical protein
MHPLPATEGSTAWAGEAPVALLPGAPHAQAMAAVARLGAWLEDEFDALKTQDMDRFEQLQPGKTEQLQALTAWAAASAPPPGSEGPAPADWTDFQEQIRLCRDAHWRNETLMSRQLDAIRGTLQALQLSDPASSVDLYDRMGQMSRRMGGRGFGNA